MGTREQTVTDMQRAIGRGRLRENNRYYNALNKAHEMVREVRLREEALQATTEEPENTNGLSPDLDGLHDGHSHYHEYKRRDHGGKSGHVAEGGKEIGNNEAYLGG